MKAANPILEAVSAGLEKAHTWYLHAENTVTNLSRDYADPACAEEAERAEKYMAMYEKIWGAPDAN